MDHAKDKVQGVALVLAHAMRPAAQAEGVQNRTEENEEVQAAAAC